MAEYIYIAESPQYPGMVKIGKTDRTVEERMEELSVDDYGIPGENIDSEWEAVKVIEVKETVVKEEKAKSIKELSNKLDNIEEKADEVYEKVKKKKKDKKKKKKKDMKRD